MKEKIYMTYSYLFAKKKFVKWNLFLFNLSLRGLGILNWKKDYLSGEKEWVKNFLLNVNFPIVIDVGAHIGKFSQTILEFNDNAKVIAFEPHPKTYKKLEKNLKDKGKDRLTCHNIAIGDNISSLMLYDHVQYDGSQHASIFQDVITDIHKSNAKSFEVKMNTLDNILNTNFPIIHVLKIDTEGFELNVLKGAKKLLKSHRIQSILFEFNSMNIISKTTYKDFYELLEDYDLFRVLPGGEIYRISYDYNPLIDEIYAYQNIVALLKRDFK